MVTGPSADAGVLGEPSYVWRSGQERRLDLVRGHIRLSGECVLDVGCGVGTYVRRLQQLFDHAYGVDVSLRRLEQGARELPYLLASAGEHLPFADGRFDLVLLNEVIEHVQDDRQTVTECLRVLKPGGHLVVYAPNRLYPFETHGIYVGRRYIFGNIPLVNYLPTGIRDRLVPHAKAYRASDILSLIRDLPALVVVHTYVFPGFDNIAARSRIAARVLRSLLYRLERSPMRRFGLSHLLILRKT